MTVTQERIDGRSGPVRRDGRERNTERIERLNTASARKLIDPEVDVDGEVGPGQVVPDELLSVYGLDLGLTREQMITLSREETASILATGIRFEATLMAAFALGMLHADLTDPRVVYELHEVGEETRHSRVFSRVLTQLQPKAVDPFLQSRIFRWIDRHGSVQLITKPALMTTMVLAGEEIPDLIQKRASEHPDTDPYIKAVNLYHRQEEARHLSFARMRVGEHWATATRADRFAVKHVAPLLIEGLFMSLVHPGVYRTVGLDGWATAKKVRRSPHRLELKHEAVRPVLKALTDAGVLKPGRIPRGWQKVCHVDRHGSPLPAAA
ncbi:MAG TPA: diiron oxygenase [Mycobacteriales bacterium]